MWVDPISILSAVPIIARGVRETAEAAIAVRQWWTGVTIDPTEVARLRTELEKTRQDVRRLSDYALFAPQVHHARPLGQSSDPSPSERDLVRLLDPVGRAMGGSVIASAPASLSHGMARELLKDPWQVFTAVQRLEEARTPGSDQTGVIFMLEGLPFIGWQKRGAMAALLDNFDPRWSPQAPAPSLRASPKLDTRIGISGFSLESFTGYVPRYQPQPQPPPPPQPQLPPKPRTPPQPHDNVGAVLSVLNAHKAKSRKLYVAPDIPKNKLIGAASHHSGRNQPKHWLGLLDYTFLGGAGRHTLFSESGIYFRVDASPYTYQTFSEFISYLTLGECSKVRSGTLGGVVLEVANSRQMIRFDGNELLRDILIDIREEALAQRIR